MITPKPFTASQSLRRTVFKGRPAVFAAEDLNRQLDAICYFADKLAEGIGIIRYNFQVSTTVPGGTSLPTISPVQGGYGMSLSVTLSPVVSGRDMFAIYRGVFIPLSTTVLTKTFEFSVPYGVAVYLYLIAKRHTTTFVENPTLSGINSDEFPTSQDSGDTIQFISPRLALATLDDNRDLNLAAEEEIIGILWSYEMKVSRNGYQTVSRAFEQVYHASDFSALASMFPLNDEVEYDGDTHEVDYLHNGSVVETLLRVNRNLVQRIEALEAKFTGFMATPIYLNNSQLASVLALDTSFVSKPFVYSADSKLGYRTMLSKLYIDINLVFSYNGSTVSPASIYFRLPGSMVVRTSAVHTAFLMVQAIVDDNGYLARTLCTITTVAGTNYFIITPMFEVKYNVNPNVFATTPIRWLGVVNSGDAEDCTMVGQICIDYNL